MYSVAESALVDHQPPHPTLPERPCLPTSIDPLAQSPEVSCSPERSPEVPQITPSYPSTHCKVSKPRTTQTVILASEV